ncbi:DUF397 domain-containing protein [Streptomyces griseoincarnatus]
MNRVLKWFKSGRSSDEVGACAAAVHVDASKGPVLVAFTFESAAWTAPTTYAAIGSLR